MDSPADFQRILEEMDKLIQAKRQELIELDQRLEVARVKLSEQEARELQQDDENASQPQDKVDQDGDTYEGTFKEHRKLFESQLEKFSEELSELDSNNQQLSKQNEILLKKLSSSESTVVRLEDQLKNLNDSLKEVKSANLELNLQLARAESESAWQQKLLRRSHEEDEVLMVAFNDKLQSMKNIIDKKDEEIEQLRSENQFIFELIASSFCNPDANDQSDGLNKDLSAVKDNRQRAIVIANAFREKEAQIELFKEHLMQASRDLERNAILIENLTGQVRSGDSQDTNSKDIETAETSASKTQVKMLEHELEAKDKQLHWLEFRNHHYEKVLPSMIGDLVRDLRAKLSQSTECKNLEEGINVLANNIRDVLGHLNSSQSLLDHVEQMKRVVELKEAQIRKLVRELNQMDAKFSFVQKQCDILRGRAVHQIERSNEMSLDFDSSYTAQEPSDVAKEEVACQVPDSMAESSNSHDTRMTGDQVKVEDEKIYSEDEQVLAHPAISADPDLSQEEAVSADKAQTDLARDETKTTKMPDQDQAPNFSKEVNVPKITPNLEVRVGQLESENEMLELAMKEILLSIKWSDAHCSTILIDCPSLERLCQLIEARYLSGCVMLDVQNEPTHENGFETQVTEDTGPQRLKESLLFQLVVLKSELDMMRGQNEQLRADIKLQRREYQQVIAKAIELESVVQSQPKSRHHDTETTTVAVQVGDLEFDGQQHQTRVDLNDKITHSIVDNPPETHHPNMVTTGTTCQVNLEKTTPSRCSNCGRLAKAIFHLSQCLIRIETRVNLSDEAHTNRLTAFGQLIRMLEGDLKACESLLDKKNQEYRSLLHQKLMTESRVKFLEGQLAAHVRVCPLILNTSWFKSDLPRRDGVSHQIKLNDQSTWPIWAKVQQNPPITWIASSVPNRASNQKDAQQQQCNPKVTISLLQSIIDCLQARLDHKDERLRQLEKILVEKDLQKYTPVAVPRRSLCAREVHSAT